MLLSYKVDQFFYSHFADEEVEAESTVRLRPLLVSLGEKQTSSFKASSHSLYARGGGGGVCVCVRTHNLPLVDKPKNQQNFSCLSGCC